MLTVHHLNDSRAQKTIWLLEKLDLVERDGDYTLAGKAGPREQIA